MSNYLSLRGLGEDAAVAATLVERIRRDLLHRLASGERPDLRLTALAATYQASTRPVRLALAELGSAGVLAQDEGGRWTVARAPRRAAPPPAEADPERALRALLVARALAGDGSFLREDDAAERLGIGRGALRRLLAQLAGQGLVTHEPRRGWRARPATQADLDAFLAVREAMELLALDLALPRLEDARLAEFAAANAPDAEGDNRLHGYLVERAGNPYISDFFARHGAYFELLFDWEGKDEAASAQARAHHRAILAALRRRDRDAARRALSEHIRGNHPMLREMIAKR